MLQKIELKKFSQNLSVYLVLFNPAEIIKQI